ncbi:fungal-specific transcription factor domain-containing protein [Colletotrichum phormii]|uniref:Fungal-specific transcription factor domain-containing protein n=1 Tax=Colletotrichum phormii TaxID=359342 RepID=A0AAI9ZE48_9PEZI|nr:fungal-specific transcription factor domain-containing protein [Colletotrichum phormii]KAK1622865.1 fungal-specific transcription factor domain-containing protein [Colletotrichum phormii]
MHTKSRGGCLRCKSKKTKCDERKPGCARCEDRGIQCPGYALNVRWSRKHQVRVDQKGATRGSPRQSSLDASVSQRRLQQTEATSPASNQIGADVLQLVDPWLTSPFQWDLPALHQEIPSFDASSCALLLGSQEAVPTTPSWDIPFVSSAWTVDGQSPTTSSSQGEDRQVEQSFPMNGTPTIIVQDNSTRPQVEIAQPRPSQQVLESNLCELSHLPTSLSEYFFREVITLYCAWDSKTNVMRNIVETMWQSSGALYHTIQSMAAACLSEDFPHLLPVARREHGNALRLIRDRPPALPKSTPMTTTHKRAMLLSSTLLGHTSSWFSPQNLATDMFRASCSMLKDVSAETSSDADASLSFFSDTMDYWAMLLAYLTDSNQLGDYHHTNSIGPTDPSKSIEPHPYSGISHATVRLLTDTGILIFQYRKHMATVKFLTETDLDVFRAALRSARKFERALLAHRPPDLSRVTDPGDPKTPLRHLELIDEAYRCTGLLQLYRVFPDLLNERYAPWDRERLLRPVPMPEAATGGLDGHKVPSARERRTWLTKLAMYILGILRDIPFESRTRSAQPFIMVAISNELRREPQHLRQPDAACSDMGADVLDIDPASIEVARARKFVRSRLAAYTHILPLRKSRVISELIDHTWAALDAGEEDVYWLDIAREKNLGTMMG